jgi:redox-sensitive bicupin YhaK (pirin superfamily)
MDEPIVGSSPFVISNAEEIRQAIADYQSGKMGHMP